MFWFSSNAFIYRVSIAILRMPNGLDYSFTLPAPVVGATNLAFDRSSTDDVRNGATNFMHVDSNLNLAQINNNPHGGAAPNLSKEELLNFEALTQQLAIF